MKVTKKVFSYSIKRSVNYNSVNISEGIECEYDAEDTNAKNIFDNLKSDLKAEVNKQVAVAVEDLKPKKEQKDLLA